MLNKKMASNKGNSGFTLIEILVVMGLIAVLAAIVLVAINPARQFAQARNSQRQSNVETLLNALGQNLADNKGISTCTTITSTATDIGTGAGNIDLTACLTPTYIAAGIPMDPGGGTGVVGTPADTKYQVSKDATTGRYTVSAPQAELSQTVSVTR